MFIGEFTHTIDSKGRVAVPFKFRRSLGKGAVITKSVDRCLVIYPPEQWQKLAAKLRSLPMFDPKAKALARFIFSSAVDVSFDRQGRALIPRYLRKYAGLKKDAVIVGVFSEIEVWDAETWEREQRKAGVGSEKFNKELQKLEI